MNYLMKKRDAMLNSAKKSRIPSGYQEVEYITVPVGAYIDLQKTSTDIDKLETIIIPTNVSRTAQHFLGGRTNTSNYKLYLQIGNDQTNPIALYGNSTSLCNSFSTLWKSTENSVEIILRKGEQIITINDVVRGTNTKNNTIEPFNLYLFAWNANGSITADYQGRVYETKLSKYQSGTYTLQRHLIPCWRKSDNEVGFYDLIDDVFFINSGSGNFSKGADV